MIVWPGYECVAAIAVIVILKMFIRKMADLFNKTFSEVEKKVVSHDNTYIWIVATV